MQNKMQGSSTAFPGPTAGHSASARLCPGQLREKSPGSNTPSTRLLFPKFPGKARGGDKEREQQWEEALAGWGHCCALADTEHTLQEFPAKEKGQPEVLLPLGHQEQSLVAARHSLQCPGHTCEWPVPSPTCRAAWKATAEP